MARIDSSRRDSAGVLRPWRWLMTLCVALWAGGALRGEA